MNSSSSKRKSSSTSSSSRLVSKGKANKKAKKPAGSKRKKNNNNNRETTNNTAAIITPSCPFDTMIDDVLVNVLDFVGKKSYAGGFGAINKRCNTIFKSQDLPKESCIYSCLPLSQLTQRALAFENLLEYRSFSKGIILWGRNDFVLWCMEQNHPVYIKKEMLHFMCFLAAQTGRVPLFKIIFEHLDQIQRRRRRRLLPYDTLTPASSPHGGGEGRVQTYYMIPNNEMMRQYITTDSQLVMAAHKEKRLEILKWMHHEKQLVINHETCKDAAAGGASLDVFEYVVQNCIDDWRHEDCFVAALRSGSLEILQWIHSQRDNPDCYKYFPSYCETAAYHGHVEILTWLIDTGFILDLHTCIFKASLGRRGVEVLEYLKSITTINEDMELIQEHLHRLRALS